MQPSYDDMALATLRDRGATRLEVWCVAGRIDGKPCRHRESIAIDEAIRRWGPETVLVMIARRSRCRECGTRGAHVQATAPWSVPTPRVATW